jgi:hypothetical protein
MRDAQAQQGAPARPATPSPVIHIYMPGGMAHQETFDPHPNAPIEYRGPPGVIPTKISGEVFSANLPKIGQVADKICVIRSMSHGEADHDRGTHNMFTGYRRARRSISPASARSSPTSTAPARNMPPYVCIPGQPIRSRAPAT